MIIPEDSIDHCVYRLYKIMLKGNGRLKQQGRFIHAHYRDPNRANELFNMFRYDYDGAIRVIYG